MSNNIIEEAKEILQMWEDGDYDNFKDAILDCRNILEELDSEKDKELYDKIMNMLKEATQEFQALIEEDPEMASYAEGLIDLSLLEK